MHNNKKGFTLVELLATIAILSVVVFLCGVTYFNVKKNVLESSSKRVKEYIVTKAEQYASETNILIVSVEDLIKAGYIKPDDLTDIYDPATSESLNCYLINTSVDEQGNYNGTFGDEVKDENGCGIYKSESKLEICRVNGSRCDSFDNHDWFTGNQIFTVQYGTKENIDDAVSFEWTSNIGDIVEGRYLSLKPEDVSSSTYNVKVNFGDNVTGYTSKRINIDNEKPVIKKVVFSTGWEAQKTISIDATDNNGSGIYGYSLVKKGQACNTYQKSNQFTVTDAGEYKICVKDNVGLVTVYKDETGNEFIKVDKVDGSKPLKPQIRTNDTLSNGYHITNTFNIEFYGSGVVGKSNVTYYHGFTTALANTPGSVLNITSSNYTNYNKKTIYVKACNEAGICSDINSYNIKIDLNPPVYKSGGTINASGSKINVAAPVYEDDGSTTGVTVYTCVTTKNVTSNTDSCFSTNRSVSASLGCGNGTYYLYSYAVDAAGHKSAVKKHTNAYYSTGTCSYYYDDDDDYDYTPPSKGSSTSSSSSSSSSCTGLCEMQKNSEEWHSASAERRKELEDRNVEISKTISECSNGCSRNHDGYWVDNSGSKLYDPKTKK